jgi:hypothetical protein
LSQNYSIQQESDIQNPKQAEDVYLKFCRGIGLPSYTSYLLANFANKFHHSLPQTDEMKSEDIIKSLQQTIQYYRSVGKSKSLLKVSDLERIIEQKRTELIKIS